MDCCHDDFHKSKNPTDAEVIYTCPMHPEVVKNAPGKCPGCGMDLIPVESGSHAGHDMQKMSHEDHDAAMTNPQIAKKMEKDMRRRFFHLLGYLRIGPAPSSSPARTILSRRRS